uniref:Uncharacterized protein n=1 Tax=Anguilla anguilla TaxID=7936 RepID=A0A0E9W6E5_ANGAN
MYSDIRSSVKSTLLKHQYTCVFTHLPFALLPSTHLPTPTIYLPVTLLQKNKEIVFVSI